MLAMLAAASFLLFCFPFSFRALSCRSRCSCHRNLIRLFALLAALDALLASLAAILAAAYVAVPVVLLQRLTRAAGRYSCLRSFRACHLPGPSLASRRACPALAALAAVPVACRASCCASCDCHHARRTCNEPRLSPLSTPRLPPLWSRGRRACLAGRAGTTLLFSVRAMDVDSVPNSDMR